MEKEEMFVQLTNNINKSVRVRAYNKEEDIEASAIAIGLLDMQDSLKIISDVLLPSLLKESITEKEVDNLLFEIGEEIRHIRYHIKEMSYYSYINE